jgi:hypothetical protein
LTQFEERNPKVQTEAKRTILSHRILESLLGAGGMRKVYRARDTKRKSEVALKVLPGGFAQDLARMIRSWEAEFTVSCCHSASLRRDRRQARAGFRGGMSRIRITHSLESIYAAI